MKGLVIFIHTSPDAGYGWLKGCILTLASVIGQHSPEVVIVYTPEEFYPILDRNNHLGIYLPFINQKFLASAPSMTVLEETKKNIELKYSGRALTLHVLEEVISINLARVTPFFRFYASSEDLTGQHSPSPFNLPCNHTLQSFYSTIHGLANEITQLATKESRERSSVKCIFVATSTPDMESYIRNLCNYLVYNFPEIGIYNLIVAAENHKDAYSIKISKLLKNCFLSIHIFGASDDESVLNLPKFENALAANFFNESSVKDYNENLFKRLVWIPKGIEFSEKQLSFFAELKQNPGLNAGAEIISSNLEEFKEIIFSRIKKYQQISIGNLSASQVEKPIKVKTGFVTQIENIQENCVYLIDDDNYSDTLNEIKVLLCDANIPAYDSSCIPQSTDPGKWQSECLKKSIAVLILTGNWNTKWFKCNINEVRKARALRSGQKYELIAIVSHEITVLPSDIEDFSVLIKLAGKKVNKDDLTLLFSKLTTIPNID